jgi:hypothetical protein
MEEKETTANKNCVSSFGFGAWASRRWPRARHGKAGRVRSPRCQRGGPVFRVDDVKVRWQFEKSNLTQIFVFFFPFLVLYFHGFVPRRRFRTGKEEQIGYIVRGNSKWPDDCRVHAILIASDC